MGEHLQQTKERRDEREISDETIQKTGGATVEHARRTVEDADQVTDDIDSLLEESLNQDDINRLLDAIDEVLEENAEEYVENFVQQGGQ